MFKEKIFAFARAGLQYFTNAPFSRPTSSDAITAKALVCKNCANFCPVGPSGLQPSRDGTLPKWFAEVLTRWWLEDFAASKREGSAGSEGLDLRDAVRHADMLKFMSGLGLCVALPPTAASGFGAPPTHQSWWCGALARPRPDDESVAEHR